MVPSYFNTVRRRRKAAISYKLQPAATVCLEVGLLGLPTLGRSWRQLLSGERGGLRQQGLDTAA